MRRLVPPTALLLLAAVSAQGQSTTTADVTRSDAVRAAGEAPRPASDSLFRHARRLVAEGNGVAGRSLVDSLLRAADPATPAYGDALYWHGALAPTAAEAERDYRRVIVEYPLAYYADDALLAIAELEQARGDRAGALAHLQRFVKEHPSSPGRGIAALGAARLAFEQRDTTLGCSMIAAARSSAPASDVELRNQIEYHGRPCAGVAAAVSAPRTSPPAPSVSASARPAVAAPAPAPAQTAVVTAPVSTMPEPAAPRPIPPRESAPPRPSPARRDSAAAKAPVARPNAGTSRGASMFTIQLAAYDTRPPAEQLVRKLGERGVKARVSGTAKPFRVRLGFHRTRAEAAKVVAELKARGIIGFVAEEVPPAGAASP